MRLLDGGLCGIGVAYIAVNRNPADLASNAFRSLHVDVEDRNLGAGGRELFGGGGAEPGAPAGDESGMSFWIHGQAFR
jgi:hypothetical protein